MAPHHHHHRRSTGLVLPGRRGFLRDLGRGTVALAITGTVVACGDDDDAASESPTTGADSTTTTGAPADAATGDGADDAFRWERVSLGFVSAYVVARGSEAAVVDTGVEGSEDAIAEGLGALGLDLSAVGDVILTHSHPDHQGSAAALLAATGAIVHAGVGDLEAIDVDAVGVGTGDVVFGLQVIDTPGHTPGHIAVFDETARFLVAGDALVGADGGVAGPSAEFSDDQALAEAQIATLADLEPELVVFGHGDPVLADAAMEIRRLL